MDAHGSEAKAGLRGVLGRELLRPVLVAVGLLYIVVSLVEGPAIQDFLYAIF
jgi:hypothetical protein